MTDSELIERLKVELNRMMFAVVTRVLREKENIKVTDDEILHISADHKYFQVHYEHCGEEKGCIINRDTEECIDCPLILLPIFKGRLEQGNKMKTQGRVIH